MAVRPIGWDWKKVRAFQVHLVSRGIPRHAQSDGLCLYRVWLGKRVTAHLRHSFCHPSAGSSRLIQALLGHNNLSTTALYTRVADNTIRSRAILLDRLRLDNVPVPPA